MAKTEYPAGFADLSSPDADATRSARDGVPPPLSSRSGSHPLQRGDALGRYVLLSLLGSGAMGVVYSAYDPELDRIVAVKVVRGEDANDPLGRQRLLREAQALAQLSHPNVVAVHDVGSLPDGIFLAMEYVAGQTLHAWLNEAPRSQKDVLAAFRGAAAGLSAAHAVGIVHRDFKPQNVLIGRDGRPRVVDFGLARRAAGAFARPELSSMPASELALDVELAAPGELLGTPRYMAPEQVVGAEVGPAADQFAFCVALYAALYGESPFEDEEPLPSLMFALREWRVRSAPKASRVPLRLRRALLRGLSVDPQNRFASLDALLDELDYDPARSRRLWLAGAVAAALCAATGLALSAHATGRDALCSGAERHLSGVWDEARRGAVRDALLATPHAFAKDTWARLEPLLNGYAGAWAASHAEACRATRVRGEQSEHALDLRMTCLHRRRDDLKALTDLLLANPAGSAERAVQAAYALGDLRACDDLLALGQPVPPPSGAEARAKIEALSADLSVVKALLDAGRYEEGLRRANEALGVARGVGHKPSEARAGYYVGSLRRHLGDKAGAEEALMASVAAAVAGRDDTWLAQAAQELSWCIGTEQRRLEEGLRWTRIAEAAAERLGKRSTLLAKVVNSEGSILLEQRKYDEARVHFNRALELYRVTTGLEHPSALDPAHNLNVMDLRLLRFEEAHARGLEVLRLREKTLGPEHPSTGHALSIVGSAQTHLRRYDEAMASLTRALAIQEASIGRGHWNTAVTLENLAALHLFQGRDAEALSLYERSGATFERSISADHPYWINHRLHVGILHLRAGRLEAAFREFEGARAVQKVVGGDPDDEARIELAFASALYASGSRERARAVARQARATFAARDVAYAEGWLADCGVGAPPVTEPSLK